MPQDQQNLSLARQQQTPVHLSKASRQVVPAFLQKLFEMVNDPSNADLIRWSDAGDSFFVLDHERFARQVLGRWFKHQNFSSFVRQLNMYGFHKIPHLQQGVLRSDQEAEFWNFEHPNFHRGQPDLLCLIQRKKQAAQSSDLPDPDAAPGGPSLSTPSQPPTDSASTTTLGNGQVLDIHSIINGIAAIKRHQTTISAELNQLKRSNQLLWQESLAARQRHQKHQDTINRILKFLAGVFGNGGGHAKDTVAGGGDGTGGGTGGVGSDGQRDQGYHRKQVQRLMIEEGPGAGKRKMPVVQVEEEDDDDEDTPPYLRDLSPVSMRSSYNEPMSPTISEAPYINLSSPTPPRDNSSTPQIIMQPKPSRSLPTANSLAAALSPALSLSPSASTTTTTATATSTITPTNIQTTALTTVPPSPPISGNAGDQENMIQAFQQMLSSPGQIQRLLAALSAHNGNNGSGLPTLPPPSPLQQHQQQHHQQHQQQQQQQSGGGGYGGYSLPPADHYTPSGQLSLLTPSPPPMSMNSTASTVPLPPPMGSGLGLGLGVSPLDMDSNSREQREQQQRLEKTWKVTQDIDKDVNALHSSIESLIGAFGLDPGFIGQGQGVGGGQGGMMDASGVGVQGMVNGGGLVNGVGVGVGGGMEGVGGVPDLTVPEFDFDAFLNEYGNSGMTGMGDMSGVGVGGVGGIGGGVGGGIGGVGGDGDVDMDIGNGVNGVNGAGSVFLDEGDGAVGNLSGSGGSVGGSPVISFANINANASTSSSTNGNTNGNGNGNGASKKAKTNGRGHASSISSVGSLNGSGMNGIETMSPASTSTTIPTASTTSATSRIGASPKATKGRKRKSDAAEIEDMQRGMGVGVGAGGGVGGGGGAGLGGGAGGGGNVVGNVGGNGSVGGGGGGGGGTGKRKR